MKVKVTKITTEELMRSACDKTFRGKSKQTLLSMYKSEHSPIRTQMFWVELENIPLFVSTHLLRHHVGSQPYALTMRTDRGAVSFDSAIEDIEINIEDCINTNNEITLDDADEIKDSIRSLANNYDRMTPTNLGLFLNAQALIDMAKVRLCNKASKETREVFETIKQEVSEVDPDLSKMMVRKCVYRGGLCGEPCCCGYNQTTAFSDELKKYISNFKGTQIGRW